MKPVNELPRVQRRRGKGTAAGIINRCAEERNQWFDVTDDATSSLAALKMNLMQYAGYHYSPIEIALIDERLFVRMRGDE